MSNTSGSAGPKLISWSESPPLNLLHLQPFPSQFMPNPSFHLLRQNTSDTSLTSLMPHIQSVGKSYWLCSRIYPELDYFSPMPLLFLVQATIFSLWNYCSNLPDCIPRSIFSTAAGLYLKIKVKSCHSSAKTLSVAPPSHWVQNSTQFGPFTSVLVPCFPPHCLAHSDTLAVPWRHHVLMLLPQGLCTNFLCLICTPPSFLHGRLPHRLHIFTHMLPS